MIRIRISFHGGAQEVGRSCFSIESKGFTLMLDCGLKIRESEGVPTLPEHTDALILSHAHLDHSGMAPALYKKDKPKIYATDLTLETAHILQNDSAKVQQLRNETDLYTAADIEAMQRYEVAVAYGEERTIAADTSFSLMDAGHIPGSASVLLEVEGKKIFYTGDIKTVDTYLQRGADVPQADILITESTYGNRTHPDRKTMEAEFLAAVEETLDAGGNVIIPAFAVGRTQEALMILRKIAAPLYLDGMGQKVTSLFLQYSEYIRDVKMLQKAANAADWISGNGDRQRAMSEPSVIVTTAGMINGGPVMQYLQRLHMDKSSSILLTGYQVEGTNGRLMMDKGYVKDPFTNKEIPIQMQKKQFDFSAHAGRHSLEKIAKKVSPEKAFVVHGDAQPAAEFSEFLSGLCETHTPKLDSTFEL